MVYTEKSHQTPGHGDQIALRGAPRPAATWAPRQGDLIAVARWLMRFDCVNHGKIWVNDMI